MSRLAISPMTIMIFIVVCHDKSLKQWAYNFIYSLIFKSIFYSSRIDGGNAKAADTGTRASHRCRRQGRSDSQDGPPARHGTPDTRAAAAHREAPPRHPQPRPENNRRDQVLLQAADRRSSRHGGHVHAHGRPGEESQSIRASLLSCKHICS